MQGGLAPHLLRAKITRLHKGEFNNSYHYVDKTPAEITNLRYWFFINCDETIILIEFQVQ